MVSFVAFHRVGLRNLHARVLGEEVLEGAPRAPFRAKPFCSARLVRAPTAPQRFAQGKAPRKNALAMDPARESPAPCATLSHLASGGSSARGGRNDFPGKRLLLGLRRGRIRGKVNKTRVWRVFEGSKTPSNFFQLFFKTPLRTLRRYDTLAAVQRPD